MMSNSRVGSSYVLAVLLLALAFNSTVAQAIVDDQVEIQNTKIESAKATLQVAHLKRELAALALKEYEQGFLVQEKATLEAELRIARDELKMAQEHVPEAHDRSAQIKQASKGSTYDLVNEFRFSDQVVWRRAGLHEALGSWLNRPSRSSRFFSNTPSPNASRSSEAELELAKSEELAAHSRWLLEELRLKRLQNPRNQPPKTTERYCRRSRESS